MHELDNLATQWGSKYPLAIDSWPRNWPFIISHFSSMFEGRLGVGLTQIGQIVEPEPKERFSHPRLPRHHQEPGPGTQGRAQRAVGLALTGWRLMLFSQGRGERGKSKLGKAIYTKNLKVSQKGGEDLTLQNRRCRPPRRAIWGLILGGPAAYAKM
jgi:hypothetical protein